jgi:hypothetical protein
MIPPYDNREIKRGFFAPRGIDYTSEENVFTLLSAREPLTESE